MVAQTPSVKQAAAAARRIPLGVSLATTRRYQVPYLLWLFSDPTLAGKPTYLIDRVSRAGRKPPRVIKAALAAYECVAPSSLSGERPST